MTEASGGGCSRTAEAKFDGIGDVVGEVGPEGAGLDQVTSSGTGFGGASGGEPGPVEVAEAWLAGLEDKLAVAASDVQDHLLDLWGVLDEGPARAEVERWLTETLGRSVYSVSDINDRLEALLPSA